MEEHKAQMFSSCRILCLFISIEEKECILDVPASKHLDDLQMFVRLFPYFNGNHHIFKTISVIYIAGQVS